MRRPTSLLLALTACVAIGCGGGEDEADTETQAAPAPSTAPTATAPARTFAPLAQPAPLSVRGLGRAQRIEGVGHSYIGAAGVNRGEGVLALVADQLRVGGADAPRAARTVTDQLIDVYESDVGRDGAAPAQAGLVMAGLNDLAEYGRDLDGFANGLESLLSRMRAGPGDAHRYRDRTVELGEGGAGWTEAGLLTEVRTEHDLEIDVSAHRRGGTLGFVAPAGQGTGGVYRFRVDGRSAGTLDTRGLFPDAPRKPEGYTPFVARVRIPPGAKALHVRITDVAGRAGFYGWHMEARTPPLIVVLRQPRLPDYGSYGGSFHTPTDADVAALNATIDRVAARFEDGLVVTADAEEIAADPALFQDDRLHPNAAGHRELARAAVEAFRAAGGG